MEIATGTPESHPTPLPLDASHSPGVAPPTAVSGQLTPADQGGVFDAAATFAEQAAAGTADAAAAMHAGMSAESDRRAHYAADVLPVGANYGDAVTLPLVPDNATPAVQSYLFPFSGDEPTPAGGPFGGDEPQ